MTSWDPALYRTFAAQRLRPGIELVARIPTDRPTVVHDVGCGEGTLTRMLADRWPDASIVGSDISASMLEQARMVPSRVEWRTLDLREAAPQGPVDVIFSNAVLHWVPDHARVVARLFGSLAAGGCLAVQMPLSWWEPSHVLMRRALDDLPVGTPGRSALLEAHARPPVHEAGFYAELLTGLGAEIDVWETRYHQVLRGPEPVLEWVSGTLLRPVIDALEPDDLTRFLDRYREELAGAYPPRGDGTTLYPFPRVFFVAVR